jgi:dihydroorotate dehydrogenase (NAD+) catalytic subunit
MEMTVRLGEQTLKNPVAVASGTFGYGEEYAAFTEITDLGAIFTKAVTLEPREGNPAPRVVETTAGMLNSVGLANVGIDAFIKTKLPFLSRLDTSVYVNVAGSTGEEYIRVIEKLEQVKGIAGLEINISCPNVKHGGLSFGADAKVAYTLLSEIRRKSSRFLIAKLSPNVTDITEIARAAEDAGCNALSLINTLVGMAINIKTRKPKLANITGGLSGPAIKPVGVAMVWKVAQRVKIPLIGIGGIMNAEDALEYILAGATAVQVGTGNFVDPKIPQEIITGIMEYCLTNGVKSVSDIVGGLQAG